MFDQKGVEGFSDMHSNEYTTCSDLNQEKERWLKGNYELTR